MFVTKQVTGVFFLLIFFSFLAVHILNLSWGFCAVFWVLLQWSLYNVSVHLSALCNPSGEGLKLAQFRSHSSSPPQALQIVGWWWGDGEKDWEMKNEGLLLLGDFSLFKCLTYCFGNGNQKNKKFKGQFHILPNSPIAMIPTVIWVSATSVVIRQRRALKIQQIQSGLAESCCIARAAFQSNQLDVRQTLQWLVMLTSLITGFQNFIYMGGKKRKSLQTRVTTTTLARGGAVSLHPVIYSRT